MRSTFGVDGSPSGMKRKNFLAGVVPGVRVVGEEAEAGNVFAGAVEGKAGFAHAGGQEFCEIFADLVEGFGVVFLVAIDLDDDFVAVAAGGGEAGKCETVLTCFRFQGFQLGGFEFVKIEDEVLGVFYQMIEGAAAVEVTGRSKGGELLLQAIGLWLLAIGYAMADPGNRVFEVVALDRLDDLFEGAMPGDFVEVVEEGQFAVFGHCSSVEMDGCETGRQWHRRGVRWRNVFGNERLHEVF